MLPTFEKETHELTPHEHDVLLPIFVSRLALREGKKRSITNREMREGFKHKMGIELADSRVRKIIQHIRVFNIIPGLVATKKGYYVANSKEEINAYIETANKRIRSLEATRDSFTQRLEML